MGVYPPFKLTFWIKIGRLIPVAVQFLSPRSNSSEDEKHRREMQQFLLKRENTQHFTYLMVLQDFIVVRSSAHLDGLISSHWMSSSILTVEIRPEN